MIHLSDDPSDHYEPSLPLWLIATFCVAGALFVGGIASAVILCVLRAN